MMDLLVLLLLWGEFTPLVFVQGVDKRVVLKNRSLGSFQRSLASEHSRHSLVYSQKYTHLHGLQHTHTHPHRGKERERDVISSVHDIVVRGHYTKYYKFLASGFIVNNFIGLMTITKQFC
jgi:hypothetical protein